MGAQEVLLLLRAEGGQPDEETRRSVRELVASTTEAEQSAIISTLRRGASWDEALGWLAQARMDALVIDEDVYRRALALYGGSVLLDWKECLDVAPALIYRPEGLAQKA